MYNYHEQYIHQLARLFANEEFIWFISDLNICFDLRNTLAREIALTCC